MIIRVDLLLADMMEQFLDKVDLLVHCDWLFFWPRKDITLHSLNKILGPELSGLLPNEELRALNADLFFVISKEIEDRFEQAVELDYLS